MKAIAAMDLNRIIGCGGGLPWPPISDDFKWFKRVTSGMEVPEALEVGCVAPLKTIGGKLIMGRTTYEDVGDLPGRHTYVLTNDPKKLITPQPIGSRTAQYINYDYFMENQMWKWNDLWVCGGASVYQLLMPLCCQLYLTIVLDEYEGDTVMPDFYDIFPYSEILKETKKYWIVRYWK